MNKLINCEPFKIFHADIPPPLYTIAYFDNIFFMDDIDYCTLHELWTKLIIMVDEDKFREMNKQMHSKESGIESSSKSECIQTQNNEQKLTPFASPNSTQV